MGLSEPDTRHVYVDASAWIALFAKEPGCGELQDWLAGEQGVLLTARWCVVEVASGLSIKVRRGELLQSHASKLMDAFEQLLESQVSLLAVAAADYDLATSLCRHASSGLRAGDALHLAIASRAQASHLVTLDKVMASNAEFMGIELVQMSGYME
jgi:uncharacterized protein